MTGQEREDLSGQVDYVISEAEMNIKLLGDVRKVAKDPEYRAELEMVGMVFQHAVQRLVDLRDRILADGK